VLCIARDLITLGEDHARRGVTLGEVAKRRAEMIESTTGGAIALGRCQWRGCLRRMALALRWGRSCAPRWGTAGTEPRVMTQSVWRKE